MYVRKAICRKLRLMGQWRPSKFQTNGHNITKAVLISSYWVHSLRTKHSLSKTNRNIEVGEPQRNQSTGTNDRQGNLNVQTNEELDRQARFKNADEPTKLTDKWTKQWEQNKKEKLWNTRKNKQSNNCRQS